jgi:predicted AAA+ superfamily ATPase
MALSNRDRVGRAFEHLARGLAPYVDRRMRQAVGDQWLSGFVRSARPPISGPVSLDDPALQLRVMTEAWDGAFRSELAKSDRNLVFELRDVRNRWAHNDSFSADDAYRALDSIERLLTSVDAAEAEQVGRAKDELIRVKFESQARKATPARDVVLTAPLGGLSPWRDVVQPHDDVARGRFALAEFAADLQQVRDGHGAPEYVDPVEFFRRTYLTVGLRRLLVGAVERISGRGGVPVVDLQTNFGGGKTHSMIALYHLFGGRPTHEMPQEVQDLLSEAGVSDLPEVRRAVLVGTKIAPGQPRTAEDGTEIRTLWGELAWQLGGREAFDLVAAADRTSTNPGDALRVAFERFGPCLVLIDEWVAYARGLYADDTLPGGTFDTHFSFAQALTEAARAVPGCLVVVSIPASESPDGPGIGSNIEVGGTGGREALRRLRNVIGRMESAWSPASAEESFEIVRRRLFQPLQADAMTMRDATARAFGEFYRSQAAEFPGECREPAYVDRMQRAYPIHPELFARLYEDWSTLDRFQRTRGVLRLMAAVVHSLWAGGDQSPLILPASVPLGDTTVSAELTRNLEEAWRPILDADIDGTASTAYGIDSDFKNLGRFGAARRVARTVFLGSAPHANTPNRGVDARRVRLGCALPGDPVAVFGDALGRLSDRATYFYSEGGRSWFGTKPGVAKLARDRALRYREQARDEVTAEIVRRLRAGESQPGALTGLHIAPASSADVVDTTDVRLVVLGPEEAHTARSDRSAALDAARIILDERGTTPRIYRNALIFLAADDKRREDLEHGVADFLAWKSIDDEATELGLDLHQAGQAHARRQDTDRAVDLRIADTYQWLLVPSQPDPTGPVDLTVVRVDGQGSLGERAGRKLVAEGSMYVTFPPVLLRVQLEDRLAPMWERGHATVGEIWDTFARYVYLPRLRDESVMIAAVRDAPNSTTWYEDTFATADVFDERSARYLGLTTAGLPKHVTSGTFVVRPEIASSQVVDSPERTPTPTTDPDTIPAATRKRQFVGTVRLDVERLNRDFGRIVQDVLAHLTDLEATSVEVTLEVVANSRDGFPERVVGLVDENAKSLRFTEHDFK